MKPPEMYRGYEPMQVKDRWLLMQRSDPPLDIYVVEGKVVQEVAVSPATREVVQPLWMSVTVGGRYRSLVRTTGLLLPAHESDGAKRCSSEWRNELWECEADIMLFFNRKTNEPIILKVQLTHGGAPISEEFEVEQVVDTPASA
jgi:hypothetical protein|tara:strand:- start:1844 stop:2275 length:432 start_codon:yes stop_codon:yes gene_type:complete